MTERIELLDHGYLAFIESWGADERVIEAARMSTGKGFLGWGFRHSDDCPTHEGLKHKEECCAGKPGDEKLLRYLYEHKHTTPFEMGGMTVEVQAPIFVFREWHRHRTQSYSEMSSRYTPLPDLNYIPSVERLLMAGKTNKQAGAIEDAQVLDEGGARSFREGLREQYDRGQALYAVSLQCGVPKELARLHLPLGRYSRMRASANLLNWLRFLTLRMATEAQWEIRQYANAAGSYIASLFPRTWELFVEGRPQS